MITVYGRPDSSAVARVMWTLGELGFPHHRIDWGGSFGGNDERDYRDMCPSGKIPAIKLADGETLWESNAIIRYFCAAQDGDDFLSDDHLRRAKIEAWMDWSPAFQAAVSSIRRAYKRGSAKQADIDVVLKQVEPNFMILERQLSGRDYVMGSAISAADFALGVWAHRLWRCPPEAKPTNTPATWAWIERLQARPAYQEHVMAKVSAGPQSIGGG
ncbi:MAG: glutathione S-transferase family protein [Pseudomonadota bacterium]